MTEENIKTDRPYKVINDNINLDDYNVICEYQFKDIVEVKAEVNGETQGLHKQ